MLIIDKYGRERVAQAADFQDVTISFTPEEYQALKDFFEFRKTYSPSTFSKSTKTIYKKLIDVELQLKQGLKFKQQLK